MTKVAVNLFFLIKHVIVPPCKKFVENVAQRMGFDIAGRYYSKPPLTLENDRYIIDQLLIKAYNHDSHSPDFIADLEQQIAQLTTQGNPDSSYTFIRKKIGFKTTKILMLKEAQENVVTTLENPETDTKMVLRFFRGITSSELQKSKKQILEAGVQCLEQEIQRQQEKIASLDACLPR